MAIRAVEPTPWMIAMMPIARAAMQAIPPARPSTPSTRFMALLIPTIHTMVTSQATAARMIPEAEDASPNEMT